MATEGIAAGPAVPFANCYWVDPGRLLAGPHPGGGSEIETAQRVQALIDAGIRCILNLTEDREEPLHARYEDVFRRIAADSGIEVFCIRWTLWDMTTPSPQATAEVLDIVDRCLAQGLPVYVHCMAGLGRTGVVVGCWIARHGVAKGRSAVKHVSRLRRNTATSRISSPITDEQLDRVKGWKPGS